LDDLLRDLRFALRLLARTPAVTLVAIASLALGIGVNVALFTFVKAVFLQPLPIARPAEVVGLYTTDAVYPGLLQSSYLNLQDFAADRAVFSGLAATLVVPLSLAGERGERGGEAERLSAEIVSASYFRVLGVPPLLGRDFTQGEDGRLGAHAEAILSAAFWRRRFGADRAVLGRTLVLNGHPFTVVGVAAAGFNGTNPFALRDLWVPMSMRRQVVAPPLRDWFERRNSLMLDAVARLAPGVSVERAKAAVHTLAANLEREYPKDDRARGMEIEPLTPLHPSARKLVSRVAGFLMSMVALVLALAAANVANLLLSRALARRREIAIRLAIGAGRARLLRQLMTESLLLALLGGAAGLLVAFLGRRLLWAVRPPTWPETLNIAFDARVLAFALAITVATGLLFGIAPALQTVRAGLVTALKSQATARPGRFGLGLREILVAVQIALSLVLLIGTGLFLRSLIQAQRIDPGIAADRLLVASFDLSASGYDDARGQELCRRLVELVEGLPGVRSASVAVNRPLALGHGGRFYLAGHTVPTVEEGAAVSTNGVDAHYFRTLGIPLLRGRPFRDADTEKAPAVAIVNQTLADRYLPGENPIGQRLRFIGADDVIEIVGVARDSKYGALGEPPRPYVYFPLAQDFGGETTLYVSAAADPGGLLQVVRRTVHALDPALALANERTVSSLLSQSLWAPRAGAALLTLFGLLGLVLATVGTYGVIGYTVEQQRREIGIRMALGARRRDVVLRVLRRSLALAALGLAAGLAAAFLCSRLVASVLYSASALDPATFLLAPLLLATAAALASLLPARRAARVDPIRVLRAE
jgi:predicted permease